MSSFPHLDLRDAWRDAERSLRDLLDLADILYAESEETWDELTRVHDQAAGALEVLGKLPVGICEGIAKDDADLAELEARADVTSY